MKNLLVLSSFFVLFLISSCAKEIGSGELIRKASYEELNRTEKQNSEILFEKDCYWLVKTNYDTIHGILPDYIKKKEGDKVKIFLEGNEEDFITLK